LFAYDVAEKNYLAGGVNRVVLFTDGVSNITGATAEGILRKAASARRKGVANTIVSVGGDGDDKFLEALADKGDGNHVFIRNEDDADELFEKQFSARFRAVAKDVKIQVEFNPEFVEAYRQIGYDNRQLSKADFRNDKVDAGEVGAGQSVTALYELKLRPRPIPMDDKQVGSPTRMNAPVLATVRIRYKRADTARIEEREFPLRAAIPAKSPDAASPSFRLAEIAAEFAETLKYANVAKIANPGTIRRKLQPLLSGVYANDAKVAELDALLRLSR
jgi:Ca-activated chloride channel family protein